jgi:hypothetical protein
MDYLFASPGLTELLVSSEALDHERWPSPSDHFPIVASFRIPVRELDPARGAIVAGALLAMRARSVLIRAAELGYITSLACAMPECLCPEGREHFERVTRDLPDWMPTVDHYPVLKSEGGHLTVDNVRLAHRLCNNVDYSLRIGRRFSKALERTGASETRAPIDRD